MNSLEYLLVLLQLGIATAVTVEVLSPTHNSTVEAGLIITPGADIDGRAYRPLGMWEFYFCKIIGAKVWKISRKKCYIFSLRTDLVNRNLIKSLISASPLRLQTSVGHTENTVMALYDKKRRRKDMEWNQEEITKIIRKHWLGA